MKIAYTTLACPTWNMDQIIDCARQCGYHGVDFRGYMGQMAIHKLPEFSSAIAGTIDKFAAAGLEIPAMSSGAKMFCADPAKRPAQLDEIVAYAVMAKAFNARFIRVFGGAIEGVEHAEAIQAAVEAVETMAKLAWPAIIAVETHDDWVDSSLLAAVFERLTASNVCVLWDIHHPFRLAGEAVEHTFANIGRRVGYVHIKDSRPTPDGKDKSTMPGEGDVPLERAIALLKSNGYDGYLTTEWEKFWNPKLAGPEIALPAYADFLKRFC